MMNRSYRDLDSATLRTKFFGGRSADDIAREMPILPVDAPGIPPPGLSLALFARSLGDVPEEEVVIPKKGKAKAKKPKVRRPGGPHLTALVRSMLYQSGTEIPLEHGGKTVPTEMLPGSLFADGLVRDGPGPCRLMVIGKCLGRAEVANKRPFCGAGSEDLWRAWKEAGIPQVGATLPTYMTNLLRFEPPPAAVARPPADWVEDGVHLLYQELALCRPEYVLILGADALKALFGYKAKISHFKGMVTDLTVNCQPNPDTPEDKFTTRVVVADHPAAVYRDPDLYPTLLASMRFLARQMGYSATAEVLATDYQTILTADELRIAVAETEKASAGGGYVSFDCEWEGRHPKEPGAYLYTVQWSHAPGHARVAYLKRCGGADNPSLTKEAAAPLFRRLLANAPARGARLVAHFGKADLPWLEDYGVDLYPHYVGPRDDPNADGSAGALWAWQKCYFEGAFDTAVAVHAVDESNPLGLDVLTSTILGLDRYDLPVEEWKTAYCAEQKIKKSELRGYGNCSESIMTPYACLQFDSRVQLADGTWEKIGRLVRDKYAGRVKALKDGEVIDAFVTGWHRSVNPGQKWCEITTRYAGSDWSATSKPTFTPDHLVVTQRGKVRVDELVPGKDSIATADRQFSAEQTAVFLGSLLGDGGYYTKPNGVAGFGFGQMKSRGAYADWKAGVFATHTPQLQPSQLGRRYKLPCSGFLTSLSDMYPTHPLHVHGKRKGVITPKVLAGLGDLGLAVWYQDDGCLIRRKNKLGGYAFKRQSRIYCRIDEVEASLVVAWLTGLLGVGVSYNRKSGFVHIGQVAYDELHRRINPYMHPVMQFKTPLPVGAGYQVDTRGGAYYAEVTSVTEKVVTKHHGVRYCLSVPEAENFLTKVGFVSNCRDVDDPGRLYLMYNGDPKAGTQGRLDADRFGFSCRQIFSTRMRAWAAVAEIEKVGMEADRTEHKRLRDILAAKRESLVAEFRAAADWPDFAPTRRVHRVEFLFGENFLAAKDPRRPAGALSLYLEPYKATKSTGNEKLWAEAEARWKRGLTGKPLPATDQETMIALGRQHELARMLLNIDFLTTAMKIWFRLPDEMVVSDEDGLDGEEVHGKGFVACIHHDGRIRTRLGHVETGRYSSSGPNLQNVSDSTDERYDRILQWGEFAPEGSPESEMHFKSRSIFRSRPGWYFVAADLKGAEIASAGWFSGDKTLMAHAHRATLKPDDPDLLDLHADLAANTFGLTGSYKEIKKKYKALRVAAKKTRFSHYYGASADTILRQVSQETQDVTIEQIEKLIEGHDKLYPDLSAFFAACRDQARRKGRLCNGYGGSRRFRKVGDRNLQEAQGREAQNWSCQGLVADNIAYALGNLWYEIRDRKLRSRIVLTVHDSIMCECPRDEVVLFADEDSGLLKKAMSDDNPVVITTLDGVPLARGPYRFGIDISVYRSWGIECGKEEWSNF